MNKFDLTDAFIAEVWETGAGVHKDNLWDLIGELVVEVQRLRCENKNLRREVDDRSDLYA